MIKQVMPFVVGLFLCSSLSAQVPKQINYQGIARNAYGTALGNQTISLRLTVRESSATGAVMYQETRTVQTNQFGLFSTAIGGDGATSVTGTLGGVNWTNGQSKFLQVEMDPKGGSQYTSLGATPLTSVPFAFRAESASPVGAAGGDLSGSFPNPTIKDGSITAAKLAPGVIPTSIPMSGTAGGDLTGSFPNPTIKDKGVTNAKLANNAVATANIADGSVTAAKLAPGVIPTSIPMSGAAGGDLSGTYPNPSVANGAIGTAKLEDGSVTAAKLAPGVIPTSIPMSGTAGGDLNGTYPNPSIAANAVSTVKLADNAITSNKIANNAVTTAKVADGSITLAKLAPGVIPTIIPTAGGDLTGTYPNPTIAANAITTAKVADGSITAAKLAPGVIPTSIPMSGTAGGDLTGTYPNPTLAAGVVNTTEIANNAITTVKVADASITAAKLAPGVIPTSLPMSGTAGGDLNGSYPNPTIANNAVNAAKIADNSITTAKVADASITTAKLAPGVIPTSLPMSGTAGGDLSGTYPNPVIAANAVSSAKIADNAVTTNKINAAAVTTAKIADNSITTAKVVDASITAAKLAPGVIPTSLPVSGTAGGDLTGTYPNPTIAANAVNTAKIADNSVTANKIGAAAVTTAKVADASITAVKLAAGVIPASLPPSGTAGGDLSGSFPSPVVSKINGITLNTTAPTVGQVLKYNGSQWAAAADNTGGGGLTFPFAAAASTNSNMFALTNAGSGSSLTGINAADGTGVTGTSVDGFGLSGTSDNAYGVYGTSNNGFGGWFDITNPSNGSDALMVTNTQYNAISASSILGNAVVGVANDLVGAGIYGYHTGGGEAVSGITNSAIAGAISGTNEGSYAGVRGQSYNGIGVLAEANTNGGSTGTAFLAHLEAGGSGTLAIFRTGLTNVARIDRTGKAFFNNGTQTGGADVAEFFEVKGAIQAYEPGDVLEISTETDRQMVKSSKPYSTLVAGVYATKPGLLLTEKDAVNDAMDDGVPMGVIGVIPTKVCLEGGAIKRGDLLVTSSTSGVAMKGDPEKIKIGQVIGKALQDYNAGSIGKINVLVSIK